MVFCSCLPGFANAVGLAIAQAHMAGTFNKESFPVFDNHTFSECFGMDIDHYETWDC